MFFKMRFFCVKFLTESGLHLIQVLELTCFSLECWRVAWWIGRYWTYPSGMTKAEPVRPALHTGTCQFWTQCLRLKTHRSWAHLTWCRKLHSWVLREDLRPSFVRGMRPREALCLCVCAAEATGFSVVVHPCGASLAISIIKCVLPFREICNTNY